MTTVQAGQLTHRSLRLVLPTSCRTCHVCSKSAHSLGLLQGFPDDFHFYGNVHNKHRQIGNAVPPPLALALGKELRLVLEQRATERRKAILQAQLV